MMKLLMLILLLWLQTEVLDELEGVVVLDADGNHVSNHYDDVSSLPPKLVR